MSWGKIGLSNEGESNQGKLRQGKVAHYYTGFRICFEENL